MAWEGLRRFTGRSKRTMPDGLWTRCDDCRNMIYRKAVEERMKTCSECGYHFPLTSQERIELVLDRGSFQELWSDLAPADPLKFVAVGTYQQKIEEAQNATGLRDAAVVGRGTIEGIPVLFGVTDWRFLMGSMGSVVGEKITRLAEEAREEKVPLIVVSGSGGGARMQEGCLSLMQMAKTSAAIARLHDARGFFLSVLTNPTMAGVLASFASLGDVILAEPKALIGFTGPRVIEQTIKQTLPPGFQRSEFLLEHGLVDMVVPRTELKARLVQLLEYRPRY